MPFLRLILISCLIVCLAPAVWALDKAPNVAGQFYPSDAKVLAADVRRMLDAAPREPLERARMIVAPHAGYVYSGEVAAAAYKAVEKNAYRTVVILASSHFHDFPGASVWPEGALVTPLGSVAVDADLAAELQEASGVLTAQPQAFEKEHSLEVQLPFVQTLFPEAKIVPIILGRVGPDEIKNLGAALAQVIGEREDVLLVVSTDLSHYNNSTYAERVDALAVQAIAGIQPDRIWPSGPDHEIEMCGLTSVMTALVYAQLLELEEGKVLAYRHSGDVTGDNERVVGYAAVAFSAGQTVTHAETSADPSLGPEQKKTLLNIARRMVEQRVRNEPAPAWTVEDPRLQVQEGAFVTLNKDGHLRGCIGHIVGQGPLWKTVATVAVASALEDPRFPPVQPEELAEIEVEVSVLSTPQVVHSADEIELGRHGVIVRRGRHSGVFLPQVAGETGWSKEEFLTQLCVQKAELPPDCWQDMKTNRFEVFTAEVFSESDVRKEADE